MNEVLIEWVRELYYEWGSNWGIVWEIEGLIIWVTEFLSDGQSDCVIVGVTEARNEGVMETLIK